MELVSNAFNPWKDGNHTQNFFVGDPNGKPYVVRVSEDHFMAINALIFAQSKKDAIQRIRNGLETCLEFVENIRKETRYEAYCDKSRILDRLDAMNHGVIECEEFDPKYVCNVAWGTLGIF